MKRFDVYITHATSGKNKNVMEIHDVVRGLKAKDFVDAVRRAPQHIFQLKGKAKRIYKLKSMCVELIGRSRV